MKPRKRIILLGASGSIGKSALDVIRAERDSLELVAASVHQNETVAAALRDEFGLKALCVSGPSRPMDGATYRGAEGLIGMIRETEADIVLNAVPGAAGIDPSMAAAESGKDLALANKESMVCAGRLLKEALASSGARLFPVDSEHSALSILLERMGKENVEELILTASGGPFRDCPLEDIAEADLSAALAHPTWSMGRKITVDSATMANKGLEVMEAIELFGFSVDSIKVLIHPESKVHSLVRCRDGSLYAQISRPDMRLPIHNALFWPEIRKASSGALDLRGESLSFREPEAARYPVLSTAYEAARLAAAYPIAFNAANEEAVAMFLDGGIAFTGIAEIVEETLGGDFSREPRDMETVHAEDGRARASARAFGRKREKR
jgi:1-deoxy-D-xylulose-5-phosphate reductoisomerase